MVVDTILCHGAVGANCQWTLAQRLVIVRACASHEAVIEGTRVSSGVVRVHRQVPRVGIIVE